MITARDFGDGVVPDAEAMARMSTEGATLDGTAILTTITTDAVTSAE